MKAIEQTVWIRLVFAFIAVFGIAFAVTGLASALPVPSAGGTCGPGRGSEAAIEALADPVTIGAGSEPPVTHRAAHKQWISFVNECQTSADDRGAAALAIVVGSVVIGLGGPLVIRRLRRSPPARSLTY